MRTGASGHQRAGRTVQSAVLLTRTREGLRAPRAEPGRTMRRLTSLFILAALLAPQSGARAKADCDWPMYAHDLGHSGAVSPGCTEISRLNVASLRPKWLYPTGATVTASPAVVGGVVYVGAGDGTFYAFAEDPPPAPVSPLWTFTVTDGNAASYGVITSSASVLDLAGTRVVIFGGASTLYVLDAATGMELASSCFDPRLDPAVRCRGSSAIIEIESSPAVVKTDDGGARIWIGMDYNEGGIGRAGVISLELRRDDTGWSLTPRWKFDPEALAVYTTDSSRAGEAGFVLTDDPLRHGGAGQGCGNVWTSPAVDLESGLVFFATGNCSTGRYKDKTLFGGEATFALDADSGALVWCYTPRGVNNLDLDFGASPNLLPDGRVGEGGKDGVYYAFARGGPETTDRTCKMPAPVWSTMIASPSSIGGMESTPAVGTAGSEPAVFATSAIPVSPDGTFPDPSEPQRSFGLHAISARDGSILWDAPVVPSFGGPTYANGVVFAPSTVGFNVSAWDAELGVPLWTFPLGAPSSAAAIVGDSVYLGSATTADPFPFDRIGAVAAFELAM